MIIRREKQAKICCQASVSDRGVITAPPRRSGGGGKSRKRFKGKKRGGRGGGCNLGFHEEKDKTKANKNWRTAKCKPIFNTKRKDSNPRQKLKESRHAAVLEASGPKRLLNSS